MVQSDMPHAPRKSPVIKRLKTTDAATRAAIHSSPDSIRTLAARYGIDPKTVAKWRARPDCADLPRGPRHRGSTVLTPAEEAMCVGFRRHAMLPLDDCLYALQLKLPHLTRSALHRLYLRHGVSRLPGSGDAPAEGGIGDFYIDSAAVRTGTGFPQIFIAFDRTSRFAFADIFESEAVENGEIFLSRLVEATPYAITAVRTGDGASFVASVEGIPHPFVAACDAAGIRHTVVASDDPWAIGRYRTPPVRHPGGRGIPAYADPAALAEHYLAFFDSYNFTRRLKTLNGRTPYEYICDVWHRNPELFRVSPEVHRPGMHNRRQA